MACNARFGLDLAAEAVLLIFGCLSKTLALPMSDWLSIDSETAPWLVDVFVSLMMLFADSIVMALVCFLAR